MDDSLNLARADVLEYPTALKTTEYLTKETDFIPWSSAITAFVYLEDMMKRSAGIDLEIQINKEYKQKVQYI